MFKTITTMLYMSLLVFDKQKVFIVSFNKLSSSLLDREREIIRPFDY